MKRLLSLAAVALLTACPANQPGAAPGAGSQPGSSGSPATAPTPIPPMQPQEPGVVTVTLDGAPVSLEPGLAVLPQGDFAMQAATKSAPTGKNSVSISLTLNSGGRTVRSGFSKADVADVQCTVTDAQGTIWRSSTTAGQVTQRLAGLSLSSTDPRIIGSLRLPVTADSTRQAAIEFSLPLPPL